MPRRLECHTAFGGTARASNLNRFLNGNPSILVATPGRLKDYLTEAAPRTKLAHIQTLILDEADTMLERGFLADVSDILRLLPAKAAARWQGMCFSATIPAKIKEVIARVLGNAYTTISTIDKSEPPTLATCVPYLPSHLSPLTPPASIDQYSLLTPSVSSHFTSLHALLAHECANGSAKIIVFGITANMVALYAKAFAPLLPLKVHQLQSRLSQPVRTRTTEEFKAADAGIMFASDVIGRGMDFPNVDLVIQVGLPSSAEQYVHRVGRTARAGKAGRAVIVLTEAESFFPRANRLPVAPHPASSALLAAASAADTVQAVQRAMHAVDDDTKRKAYSSFLGFFAGSGLLKPLRLDKPGLVAMANDLAVHAMCCPEPPALERSTVGKMGLKGVAGLRYAHVGAGNGGGGGGGGADDSSGFGHRRGGQNGAGGAQNGGSRGGFGGRGARSGGGGGGGGGSRRSGRGGARA